jgi:hypothetical protein
MPTEAKQYEKAGGGELVTSNISNMLLIYNYRLMCMGSSSHPVVRLLLVTNHAFRSVRKLVGRMVRKLEGEPGRGWSLLVRKS